MRLWSIHPRYLDVRGLTALWREGLLAQKVLQGKTRGYRLHPQLDRFRAQEDPVRAIGAYLSAVLLEAERRGYAFDGEKIARRTGRIVASIAVTRGQMGFEWQHLLCKLLERDGARHARIHALRPAAHPLFRVYPGPIEPWEKSERVSRHEGPVAGGDETTGANGREGGSGRGKREEGLGDE